MERCAVCDKQGDAGAIRRCSRCRAVRYCSRDCQSRDWSRHRVTCTTGQPSGESAAQAGTSSVGAQPELNRQAPPPPSPYSQQAWTNLFSSLFPAGNDTWSRARSRAQLEFPGNQVIDDFNSGLDLTLEEITRVCPFMPFMPFSSFFPFAFPPMLSIPTEAQAVSSKVLVMRLVVPLQCGWLVEDSQGENMQVWFDTQKWTAPLFRFDDLQKGHFLFVKHPKIIVLFQRRLCFICVEDASSVRSYSL